GTTVTITGGGWVPGESVTLSLVEYPLHDVHSLAPVTADASGNITSTEFVPDQDDLGIRFCLTATGSVSQAQTSFTDGSTTITGIVKSSETGNPAISGATVTCDPTNGCNGTITATTDASGTYSIAASYGGSSSSITLTASLPGSSPQPPPFSASAAARSPAKTLRWQSDRLSRLIRRAVRLTRPTCPRSTSRRSSARP